jgi:hypothetical protein
VTPSAVSSCEKGPLPHPGGGIARRRCCSRGLAVARFEWARERKHSCRVGVAHAWIRRKQSRDIASPRCCFDEPALGPSACSRPGCGRLSKHITLLGRCRSASRSTNAAQRRQPAGAMATDWWIAASMRQSDAEIETIGARPKRARRRRATGLSECLAERHSRRRHRTHCSYCSNSTARSVASRTAAPQGECESLPAVCRRVARSC